MQVDWKETVAGQSKLQVRNFLRRAGRGNFGQGHVSAWFKISDRKAAALLKELKSRAWIEPGVDFRDNPVPGTFKVSKAGLRLCATTAKARIPRAKADKIMADFMERVREVNSRDELTHVVKQVRLFGSYLEGAEEVGDIDLIVDLAWRRPEGNVIEEARARADASGRQFRSFFEQLEYSEAEVKRLLRARSPYLSFHSDSDLKATGARAEVIFPVS